MEFKNRQKKLRNYLKGNSTPTAFLLACSQTKDFEKQFENNNFHYLIGEIIPESLLLISNQNNQLILFTKKISQIEKAYGINSSAVEEIALKYNAKIEYYSSDLHEIINSLRGIKTLYSNYGTDSISGKIAQSLMNLAPSSARNFPLTHHHIELIMGKLRLHKSNSEIKKIKLAIECTNKVLNQIQKDLYPGATEIEIYKKINTYYQNLDCSLAFEPIVAVSASARLPHYRDYKEKLKKGDFILIDTGASYENYKSDLTRVYPINKSFSEQQKIKYEIVYQALQSGIKQIKPGNSFAKAVSAAETVLVEGLKELGLLKGKTSEIISKKLHLPYTIHPIYHSLGINVHDCSLQRAELLNMFEAGMVISFEPALYLQQNQGSLQKFGLRLEENLYIDDSHTEVLSKNVAIELGQVQELRNQ